MSDTGDVNAVPEIDEDALPDELDRGHAAPAPNQVERTDDAPSRDSDAPERRP